MYAGRGWLRSFQRDQRNQLSTGRRSRKRLLKHQKWEVRWKKLYHKLCKRIGLVFLSVFLVLSLPVLSFADTRGKMDPDDYLFLTVFRACGVSPGVDVGKWAGLYKGYLRKTGNKALLSQVEGYASLGWGDTVQGVDTLLESVKAWLSLSDSYGTDAVG